MQIAQADIPELYPDIHIVHLAARLFCLRCLAHRLMTFGFERSINDREPRDLVALSILVRPDHARVLVREAYARGDEKLKAWIAEKLPTELPQEAVS